MSVDPTEVDPPSPGCCNACGREEDEDDLYRVRSTNWGDEEYGDPHYSDDRQYRPWFHWYCEVCYRTGVSQAHKYHKGHRDLAVIIARVAWLFLDALDLEPGDPRKP